MTRGRRQQRGQANGHPGWTRACGLSLILLLLAAISVHAFPELHHQIHDDHDSPDHQCLVTLLHSGGMDAASIDVAVPAPDEVRTDPGSSPADLLIPAIAFRLLPGRAPPACL